MKYYARSLYMDEDGDLVPSDLMQVEVDDPSLEEALKNDYIVAIAYNEDKTICFYSTEVTVVESFFRGMYFALFSLDKPWDEMFTSEVII